MCGCVAHVHAHPEHMLYHLHVGAMEARRGVESPGTGVTEGCELLCDWWELNPRPLEEQ